jgi:hypothetical protein
MACSGITLPEEFGNIVKYTYLIMISEKVYRSYLAERLAVRRQD